MSKSQVKCEQFDTSAKKPLPWRTAVLVVVGIAGGVWAYNHVSGGCLDLKDFTTYCQPHSNTKL